MCTNFQQPTSFIRVALIITSIFMLSCSLYSQSNLSGFGLELGGGHNQLFTQGSYNPDNYIDNLSANRMNLSFTPTIRLNYKSYIEQVVLLIPFVGILFFAFAGHLAVNLDLTLIQVHNPVDRIWRYWYVFIR